MAGIGFHIERLLDADSYTGTLKAYLHAGVVSSGNMLATYACLMGLVVFTRLHTTQTDMVKFQVTVTFVYCLSMLLVGPLQMVLHRYLADVLYERRPDKIVPCLRGALAFHSALAIPLGMLFFILSDFGGLDLIAATVLFGLIVWIWVCSTFLSACKSYEMITSSFAVSLLVAFLCAYTLGIDQGYTGLLVGFTLGHILLFSLLYCQVLREFPPVLTFNFGWLKWARRYMPLVAASALSNLAIWSDKIVFWFSPSATHVQGLLRYHPVYDPCMFLALVTAIPAYAHFLLALETHFYRLFKKFCSQLSQGLPFSQIARTRDRMVATLRREFTQLVKIQALSVLFVLFAAPHILDLANISLAYAHVLRISTVGVALGVGVLLHIVLLLYFDLQREAAIVAGFFAVSSGFLSICTLHLGLRFYGLGYLLAALQSLILGIYLLDKRLNSMEFIIFRKNALISMADLPEEPIP